VTTWGGNSTLRVGLNVFTDGYDTFTPSINVYVDVYVGSDNYNYSDAQHIQLSGSISQGFDFTNTLPSAPGATQYVGRATITGQAQSYGGGPTYTFTAQLSGAYNGAAPSVTVGFTLPPRPTRAPNAPGAPSYSSIAGTSAVASWTNSTDLGGGSADLWALHVATDAGFSSIVYNTAQANLSRAVTPLAPGTTYYGRAFTHTADGYGPASGTTSFSTGTYQVPPPTLSNINPDSLTVNWTAPSDPAAPSSYELQYATSAAFTSPTTLSGTWATSRAITGLTPATTYYFRVRANPGTGWGAYSPTASTATLSGAKVYVGGQWVNGVAYARVAGAWVLAKVNKRVSGSWVL